MIIMNQGLILPKTQFDFSNNPANPPPNLIFRSQLSPKFNTWNTKNPRGLLIMASRRTVAVAARAGLRVTGSFYDLLGVLGSVELPEIKRAYRQMSLKYHPDIAPPGRSEEFARRFIELREAYETLSDPDTRALYDYDIGQRIGFGFCSAPFARKGLFDLKRGSSSVEGNKDEWKRQWESQLMELLKRRNASNDSDQTILGTLKQNLCSCDISCLVMVGGMLYCCGIEKIVGTLLKRGKEN